MEARGGTGEAAILVAIGANLPGPDGAPPIATCRRAAAALDRVLPGVRLVALSGWWTSDPVPPQPGAPRFVNGVARLRASGALPDPAALLAALQRLEAAAGRERPYRNAPRTLDLDLIACGALVRDAPDPVLPHPRAHRRGFVLCPLAEVAPGWRHPRLGLTVEALLAALPAEEPRPERLPD
ncbi:2-amino-4-hydroxy-6-hydroxymethyldihydropteridine diphosphokinase [Caldovatus aquaticus]|uniref:2-amino-4-hydroxy-6-hydroxymethyldihydropteridine pyrophosphokinase n=1 Tax=Caldovatus aquaticus TaxID=2865671 RepID=A0ABS7F4S0_9PROT|nr:2-amino-4-hydroxy-6-hydroxymethyldihydropteridine diphosphokinase [Caldovatus aquaticus]MBW8270518.1 2-amino-4-hydroxy-6-hydroxymethyldihydropteridine diphosphokinase [Caldovatus aquaticus]